MELKNTRRGNTQTKNAVNKNQCHCQGFLAGMTVLYNNKAFTLIELLVVVLIIGILAAVAVPQYQKAVEKSRASQAITLLKTVFESAEAYYLANGTWPTSFEQLDIDIPWSGHTRYATFSEIRGTLSNEDWSIQLHTEQTGDYGWGVLIGRLTGPYRGSGFSMYHKYSYATDMKPRQLLCNELYNSDGGILFGKAWGEYCKKLFNASPIYTGKYLHYFRMP